MASQSIASVHQLHPVGDTCPLCDQAIPHDRAEEIARRLEEKEQSQAEAIRAGLMEKFQLEKTEAVEQQRLAGDQQLGEARKAAEAATKARLEEARQSFESTNLTLKADVESAQAKATAAEAAQNELAAQLQTAEEDADARIAAVRAEEVAKQDQIRVDAQTKAQEAAAAEIQKAQTEKSLADTKNTELESQLRNAEEQKRQAVELAKSEAKAALAPQLAELEVAKGAAEAATATARQELDRLKALHQVELDNRIREVREALEIDKTAAVNTVRQANFDDKLKLSNKVEELTRALDKKTAEELGEGAELDLFEALKAEFEVDRIERVGRGLPGADIEHVVMHNGRVCGRIVYDSKNHGAWRSDFVSKLKADQVAAKAEHAILSCRKLPAGERQLCIQDGVIVASPSRVVAIVQIIREHIIQLHTLQLSGEARVQKTAKLYDFIVSERFRGLLNQVESQAQKLEDLQVSEKRAHESQWRRQGEIYRSLSRVKAEISLEVDGIIGQSYEAEVTG